MTRLIPLSPSELGAEISNEPYDYAAALSFEDRDTAWAKALAGFSAKPRRVTLFDYDTRVEPAEETRESRAANLRVFETVFGADRIETIPKVNPFALSGLVRMMQALVSRAAGTRLLVDVTCMTRVHALASVTVAQPQSAAPSRPVYCYATPASYGFEIGSHASWKDTLFMPIGKPRLLKREGHAHGLILAGHDGERLSVALQELEPATGTIVYARRSHRPDLLRKARAANRVLASRLLALRVPNDGRAGRGGPAWLEEVVDLEDVAKLQAIANRSMTSARADRGPLILYPFGPKLAVVEVALTIAEASDVDAWAVYPVPTVFQIDYSRAVDTLWALKVLVGDVDRGEAVSTGPGNDLVGSA
jgi:hypothetical protein